MAKIDDEVQTQFPDEFTKLWVNVMFTSSWVSAKQVEMFQPFNISPQQYNILRILRGNGSWMKVHDIKSRMLDKSPNMTRLVDKLIDKGWVERKRCDQDRRVIYIQNTENGLTFVDKIGCTINFNEAHPIYSHFTRAEATQMNELLDRFREMQIPPPPTK